MLFMIPGKLPNLNDYVNACRTNRYAGASMKKVQEQYITQYIPHWAPYHEAVMIEFDFYEPDERRDIDNIAATGHKFVLDSLVAKGVLLNDNQKCVKALVSRFHVDKKNPRIEVRIREFKEV